MTGPTVVDLVDVALDKYDRLSRALPTVDDAGRSTPRVLPDRARFVVEWLAARGYELRPVDDLPDPVTQAVADVVLPTEIAEHDGPISDLVHRVMRATYAATVRHLDTPEQQR